MLPLVTGQGKKRGWILFDVVGGKEFRLMLRNAKGFIVVLFEKNGEIVHSPRG